MSTLFDLTYLCACAVDGLVPDALRVSEMDLDLVYRLASRHMLTACAGAALDGCGLVASPFRGALANGVRREMVFERAWVLVSAELCRAGIWHMPLKGAVLKDFYPGCGLREFSDYDILIDPSRADDVRSIMEKLGYETASFAKTHHDSYHKKPCLNFEMHRTLFPQASGRAIHEYYLDVKARLIAKSAYLFAFTDEDFHIFMVAHEYKHYSVSGTGLRSLLDTYVFLKNRALNWNYVEAELEKLGLKDFERTNRSLALHLFGQEELSQAERAMLSYIASSGTYGNVENRVSNQIEALGGGREGKRRYVYNRLFPSREAVKAYYPTFARHRVLLLFLPIYRAFHGLLVNGKRLKSELRALKKQGE